MKTSKLYLSAILMVLLVCNKGSDKEKQVENSTGVEAISVDRSEAALTEKSKTLPLEKITLPAGFKGTSKNSA